jgi:alpha-1,3-glucosyltransferase
MDMAEKAYLAGFPFLLAFVTLYPAYMSRKVDSVIGAANYDRPGAEVMSSAMEFLPLMATSVYCAAGIVWGYLRLLFVYLNEERIYQGQLSTIK